MDSQFGLASVWTQGDLVTKGVVDDISHEGLRKLLRDEGVSFSKP